MKKILIVSYMFPPIGGSGTQRPLKFAKYLPSFGIEPIVFCPRVVSWKAYDQSPLNQPYFRAIRVHRCGIDRLVRYYRLRYEQGRKNHPYNYLLALKYIWFLDFFSAWYFECRTTLLDIARKETFACVFTTSPPHSIHLFGRFLKKRLGIPWIMDLRDAMTDDPNRLPSPYVRFQSRIETFYEKRFYPAADAIVTVSDPIRDSILKRHPALGLEPKIHVITNGFDDEDFGAIRRKAASSGKFTVTYTGSFMGKRTPEPFLQAIHTLVSSGQIDPKELLIQFVGHYDPAIQALFQRFAADIPLEVLGFQPYETSLRYQVKSDLLLLIVNIDEKEGGSQIMTGKFFEYVGAGRPIFALVPEGTLKWVITKGRFGMAAPQKDVDKIAAAFKNLYDTWKSKGRLDIAADPVVRDAFSRRRLTQRLAALINSLDGINRPPSGTSPFLSDR